MHPGSVVSGAAFRSVALSLLVSLLALLAIGLVIYSVVKSAMYDELEAQITAEVVLFTEIYQNSGREALVDTMARLESHRLPEPKLLGLFDENARRLAGNMSIAPEFVGWRRVRLDSLSSGHDYFAHASRIEQTTLVVGRNLRFIDIVLDTLLRILLFAGLAVSLVSLAIGYFFSRASYAKLRNLADTLDRVSQGDTGVRLPISDADDQIDRISRQLNLHLERLSTLIDSTRNTANSIAHDLRTPLNRAFLVLQQARACAQAGEELEQLIGRAEDELANVGQIFDTILRISKLEASTAQTGFGDIGLVELLAEMAETYQPVVEAAGQSLDCDGPDGVTPIIRGDKRMLRQMLANLIENASFHCPAGTAIRLSLEIGAGGRACIAVSDNGPGVPAEYRKRVLEPFYRLDASRNRPGSGLGLALVKAIAVHHNATVELFDNAPGLRIEICFPVKPAS